MATRMEAPIDGSEVGGMGEIVVLHEDATPPIHHVIAAWRAADRELAGLVEGVPEWNRIHAEVVGLRVLHHHLFEARMARYPTDGESSDRWVFAIMAWGPAPLPARVMA